eukprot:4027969-Pleurochrysis_carterae.AAC.1
MGITERDEREGTTGTRKVSGESHRPPASLGAPRALSLLQTKTATPRRSTPANSAGHVAVNATPCPRTAHPSKAELQLAACASSGRSIPIFPPCTCASTCKRMFLPSYASSTLTRHNKQLPTLPTLRR